jgi:peptide/nickel transport system permease protein
VFLVDQTATREEIAHTRHLLASIAPCPCSISTSRRRRGDFGRLIRERRPAMHMVLEHFWPATVELALVASVLATLLAIPLGIVSATKKDRAADYLSRLASLFLQSMPSFWLGLLLILLFAVELHGLLPAYGAGTWRHLVLPAITLAAAPLAQNTRLVRAGMLEVLHQDYVRTARAKGVSERLILYRHALRNVAIPFITVTGLSRDSC